MNRLIIFTFILLLAICNYAFSAYSPTNPNGQATMANSSPVVLASDQSTINVNVSAGMTGYSTSALQTTGNGYLASLVAALTNPLPVSGTFWQATQPVSAASLPLPSGAATAAKQPALGTAGSASSDVITVQGITSMTPLKVDGSGVTQPVSIAATVAVSGPLTDTQLRASAVPVSLASAPTTPVTGTFWQATQPVSIATAPALVASSAVIGKVGIDQTTPGTTNGVQINAALPAGSNAIGKLAANSGVDIGDVDVTSIVLPTLTKGTQGSTGVSVQELKDAGRTNFRYYAVAAAAGTTTTETAITLTKSSQDSATTTGTSFACTNGKTFRIVWISFATRGHNTATAQTTTFNLRMNTAGAVGTTSTPVLLAMRSATPATANAWDRVLVDLGGEGIEIICDGTKQFGVTAAATYTTNAPTWDVTIIGYEY